MLTRRMVLIKRSAIVLSSAMVALLAAGCGLWGTVSGESSTPEASTTAISVGGEQPDGVGATVTPVDDGQAGGGTATGITEERVIELAVQYGRSWGLKEVIGVHDIGKMKMLDYYALRGDEPTPGQSNVWQNTVWVVSLDGMREACSPPDFYGKLHCVEYDNMYVVLDAASGRVYSWGSIVAGPLTIPK